MTELVLLLTLWPFHKTPKQPISKCAVQGKLYFYAGDDGMIGFSPYNCEAAINSLYTLHIDLIRMSRA